MYICINIYIYIYTYIYIGHCTMTYLDSILKCRDTTLPTKVPTIKVMILPVVIYGCESWII